MEHFEQREPLLVFDFKRKGKKGRTFFTNPATVITTNRFDEVEMCLKQIDAAVRDGYYAAGYINYEATYGIKNITEQQQASTEPLIWFGIFSKKNTFPNVKRKAFSTSTWCMLEDEMDYQNAVRQVLTSINRSEIEQINYTVQFNATFSGCPYSYYETLRKAQKANYCAYLHIGKQHILSISPELFFHYDAKKLTLKPMKGTKERGFTYEEDERKKRTLFTSKKDRHENDLITALMIDELKNGMNITDIHVRNQYAIQTYPTVHQMTTTIEANVNDTLRFSELIMQLFPCGSIAGTPKRNALELISHLERQRRGVYCGTIGFITPDNEAVFNVPIRTVTIDEVTKRALYGAGGAITKHSNVDDEFQEVITKTNVLHYDVPDFSLLETFLLTNGSYFLYDEHLRRLEQSATYFQFSFSREDVVRKLDEIKAQHHVGNWRVRLTVHENGESKVDIEALKKLASNRVRLAKTPLQRDNVFLYHKTTERTIYETHAPTENEPFFDVLLWNEQHEITEFTIGNVVVELDGVLVTPPVTSGLLPGTFRHYLLRSGTIRERVIYIDDLARCTNIWFINSVRQWIKVTLEVI